VERKLLSAEVRRRLDHTGTLLCDEPILPDDFGVWFIGVEAEGGIARIDLRTCKSGEDFPTFWLNHVHKLFDNVAATDDI